MTNFYVYRKRLTADRTYYVDASLGSDLNTGLEPTVSAFATIQKALDVVFGTLDLGGYNVTIQLADGSYAKAQQLSPQVGAGAVTIQGNVSTPANVVVGAGVAGPAILAQNGAVLTLAGFEVSTSSGALINASRQGVINFSNMRIGVDAGGNQVRADDGGIIIITGNYSIVGGGSSQCHWNAVGTGIVRCQNRTITLISSQTYTTGFASVTTVGAMLVNGCTFVGAAVGPLYAVTTNGILQLQGITLPGDSAGSTSTGGQII